jgi:MATE family multidrug resistance protein
MVISDDHKAVLSNESVNYRSIEQSDNTENDEISFVEQLASTNTDLKTEIKIIGRSSIPMVITFFLQYSLTVVSIFSVGHLGKSELAAVSLSTMTFNITNAVFNGMSTCLDTLCSQAYGAGKKELVGLHFQRCSAMIFVTAIPLFGIWWFSSPILHMFVPSRELTDLAQLYLRIISFGTPGYILFETGKRFLQAQGIFHAAQYVLFICTPINIILNYLLVWDPTIGIGFAGAPLATAINFTLMALLLFGYVLFIDGKQCWGGLQIKKSFENWGPMISLALPGVIMVEAEFLAFEILTLSAARLGTEVLAAQSIASTLCTLVFQIPFGVAVAGSTRIATHVGSQCGTNAKIATKASMCLSLVLGLITANILFFGRSFIVSMFTSDAGVTKLAKSIIGILAVNQLVDTINIIAAGCLRGQGRQKVGSNLNLLAYYLVAVPLALYLAFERDMELRGLWLGLGIGIFVLALSETFFVMRANWNSVLRASAKRNRISG